MDFIFGVIVRYNARNELFRTKTFKYNDRGFTVNLKEYAHKDYLRGSPYASVPS